jgi:RecB family endonuclease NucS
VKCHDSLNCRFAQQYNYQRALCEDPKVIKDWFKRLKEVQEEHGIQDKDIYNFDKTGFAMGLIATTKVVT